MRSRLIAALLLLLFVAMPAAAQYQQALPGYKYEFPRDHFDHPDYRTEWWYYTGNLRAADGHRFGFELTFFRQAVDRKEGSATSTWSVRDLYLAHLALSDIDRGRFYHTERLNRSGPGLAGVSLPQQKVWNGNWQVQWSGDKQSLQALSEDFSLRLAMASQKPPVIHGRNGVSQKGNGGGNASHYISFTRLLTTGTIELGGKTYTVEGTSWMDHEFFSSGLDQDEVGWDWLSLQLADNTEVMLYRLRHKNGSVDPYSSGTYVDASGKTTYLGARDFTMTPTGESYTSPASKARYPTSWRVVILSLMLDLEIKTPLASQELTSGSGVGPSYWEGAIDISGTRGSEAIRGVGYLEMTGYGKALTLGTK
jgi:predicted secreted hydrolase